MNKGRKEGREMKLMSRVRERKETGSKNGGKRDDVKRGGNGRQRKNDRARLRWRRGRRGGKKEGKKGETEEGGNRGEGTWNVEEKSDVRRDGGGG